jgi:diphthamide synthase subunit DPH2
MPKTLVKPKRKFWWVLLVTLIVENISNTWLEELDKIEFKVLTACALLVLKKKEEFTK